MSDRPLILAWQRLASSVALCDDADERTLLSQIGRCEDVGGTISSLVTNTPSACSQGLQRSVQRELFGFETTRFRVIQGMTTRAVSCGGDKVSLVPDNSNSLGRFPFSMIRAELLFFGAETGRREREAACGVGWEEGGEREEGERESREREGQGDRERVGEREKGSGRGGRGGRRGEVAGVWERRRVGGWESGGRRRRREVEEGRRIGRGEEGDRRRSGGEGEGRRRRGGEGEKRLCVCVQTFLGVHLQYEGSAPRS